MDKVCNQHKVPEELQLGIIVFPYQMENEKQNSNNKVVGVAVISGNPKMQSRGDGKMNEFMNQVWISVYKLVFSQKQK